jgi:SAM-dependent methyltransferase
MSKNWVICSDAILAIGLAIGRKSASDDKRMKPQQQAEKIFETIFLGGPVKQFEAVGRLQLMMLLRAGLYPSSKVVDIGCGCLRGGYWLIHFLNKGCYFGVEPNTEMLETGKREFLEKDVLEEKRPRFGNNAKFDTSVFDEKFDFFFARSIWTHASKAQIKAMLDSFQHDAVNGGIFLTSYLRANLFKRRDYKGNEWVGRSHRSDRYGVVHHRFGWIKNQCRKRQLNVKELDTGEINNQTWLMIEKA